MSSVTPSATRKAPCWCSRVSQIMTSIQNEIRNAIVFVVAVLITSAVITSIIPWSYLAAGNSRKVVPTGHSYRTISVLMGDQIARALISVNHTPTSRILATFSIIAFSFYVWANESVQLNATVFRRVRIQSIHQKMIMVFVVLSIFTSKSVTSSGTMILGCALHPFCRPSCRHARLKDSLHPSSWAMSRRVGVHAWGKWRKGSFWSIKSSHAGNEGSGYVRRGCSAPDTRT